jgi:septal ring factor EnvC (AmiA/AmiB activator)
VEKRNQPEGLLVMTEFETKALELLQSIAENIKSIREAVDSTVKNAKDKEDRKIDVMNKTIAGFRDKHKK